MRRRPALSAVVAGLQQGTRAVRVAREHGRLSQPGSKGGRSSQDERGSGYQSDLSENKKQGNGQLS